MTNLVQRLHARIKDSGPITYHEFVEMALYDPAKGYYRHGKPEGRDFLTSPEVHTVFGETIAHYALQLADSVREKRFSILELGGGAGPLGKAITSVLPRSRLEKYVILEKARKGETGGLVWINDVEKLPFFDSFTIVIANEFFDALPFHRVVMDGGELREIYLGCEDGLADFSGPLSSVVAAFLATYPLYLNEHQTLEVTPALTGLTAQLASRIDWGSLLILDYGYHLEDIASGAFFDGSMVSYSNYAMSPDVFSGIGERDISHHVNFDHLAAILAKEGWLKRGEMSQHRFLIRLGIPGRILSLARLERRAARMLIDPEGMGSAFRVLGFSKGGSMALPGF